MTRAQPPRPTREDVEEPEADNIDDAAGVEDEDLDGDGDGDEDIEATDELSEETGIDLTDASELDADNVTADEEFDRVKQAED
jgi:hypothetical protein